MDHDILKKKHKFRGIITQNERKNQQLLLPFLKLFIENLEFYYLSVKFRILDMANCNELTIANVLKVRKSQIISQIIWIFFSLSEQSTGMFTLNHRTLFHFRLIVISSLRLSPNHVNLCAVYLLFHCYHIGAYDFTFVSQMYNIVLSLEDHLNSQTLRTHLCSIRILQTYSSC